MPGTKTTKAKVAKPIATPPNPDEDIAPLPEPPPVETAEEPRPKHKPTEDEKTFARDVRSGRRLKANHVTEPMTGGTKLKGEVEGKPHKGALEVFFRGHRYAPIACGVHRSVPVFESATDDLNEQPPGFDPKCEACKLELDTTLDAARRANPALVG